MRKKTKHRNNPVQRLRLACKMKQSEFAALIGYTYSYLRKVESGVKPISPELESQILVSCGASRRYREGRFYAHDSDDTLRRFSRTSFRQHKDILKGYFRQWNIAEIGLKALQVIINELSFDNHSEEPHRTNSMCAKLTVISKRIIKRFGLKPDLRKKILILAKSTDKEERMLGSWLCMLTESDDMWKAWYA